VRGEAGDPPAERLPGDLDFIGPDVAGSPGGLGPGLSPRQREEFLRPHLQRFLCLIGLPWLHIGLVPAVAQKSPHVRCRSCALRYIWPGACEPLYPPYAPFCPGLGHALPQDGGVRYSCQKWLTSRASVCILPRQQNAIGIRQGACHTACWVVNITDISSMGTADSRQYRLCRAMNAPLARRPAQATRDGDAVPFALHGSRFACTLSGFRPSMHRAQSLADSLGSYPRERASQ
jgi:hypothetical protein